MRPIVVGGAIALLIVAVIIAALVVLGGSPVASPSPSPSPATTLAPTASAAPLATVAPTAAPVPTIAPTTAPGATLQPAPLIRTFEGPTRVNCSDPGFAGTIQLAWRVGFADGATLAIDGPGLYKTYVGVIGQDDVPFSCGGEPHSYTLTTTGGNGPPATKTLVIGPAN